MSKTSYKSPELSQKINEAPHLPGCYLFKDDKGAIIYVGKSKCLHERVKQYFMPANQQEDKGLLLAKLISDVEYRITNTDRDALLLEYRLIKEHRPWFNIQHKYDWPKLDLQNLHEEITRYYLCFRQGDTYPILEILTRESIGYICLGEFRTESRARNARDLVNRAFKLPTCKNSLKGTAKHTCLNYDMENCLGPCIGAVSKEEYSKAIREIVRMFKGKDIRKFRQMENQMQKYAADMEFEKAQIIKKDLEDLKRIRYSSSVRFRIPDNRELIVFLRAHGEEDFAAFYINDSKVIFHRDFALPPIENEIAAFLHDAKSANASSEKSPESDGLAAKQEAAAQYDEILLDGIQRISADKLAVLLPLQQEEHKIIKLIHKKIDRWYRIEKK